MSRADPTQECPRGAVRPPVRRGRWLAAAGMVVLVLSILGGWGWRRVVRHGVAGDLAMYQEVVQGSPLEETRREDLLALLEAAAEGNRRGGISLRAWVRVARIWDPAVEDRRILEQESVACREALKDLAR